MKKLVFLLLIIMFLISCGYSDSMKVEIDVPVLPVLTGKEYNPVQKIHLIRNSINESEEYIFEKIVFSLEGTTDVNDIEEIMLFKAGENEKFVTDQPVGGARTGARRVTFDEPFPVAEDTLTLWVAIRLKEEVDLTHRVAVTCKEVVTDEGKLRLPVEEVTPLRV